MNSVFAALAALCLGGAALLGYRRNNAQIRRQREESERHYEQIESLFSIHGCLELTRPLPAMRKWAASPDLLKTLITIILDKKPKLVVELGSGVSTLIMAYCLKKQAFGRVVAFEHDPEHASATAALIASHGLAEIVEVRLARLEHIVIEEKQWLWYDIGATPLHDKADLLFVDGPPGSTGPLARYPAWPLLKKHLHDGCTIVLDDGNRPDERTIVDLWRKDTPSLRSIFLPLEKGAFILQTDREAIPDRT